MMYFVCRFSKIIFTHKNEKDTAAFKAAVSLLVVLSFLLFYIMDSETKRWLFLMSHWNYKQRRRRIRCLWSTRLSNLYSCRWY